MLTLTEQSLCEKKVERVETLIQKVMSFFYEQEKKSREDEHDISLSRKRFNVDNIRIEIYGHHSNDEDRNNEEYLKISKCLDFLDSMSILKKSSDRKFCIR